MGKFGATAVSIDELIQKYEGLIPEVDQDLMGMAVTTKRPFPLEPEGLEGVVEYNDNGDPLDPRDMTEVTDVQTGKLFNFWTEWTNYIQSLVTIAYCDRLVAARSEKVVFSALRDLFRTQDKPTADIEDAIAIDPRYVEVDTALLRAQVIYKQLDAAYERAKRNIHLISREQTRRNEELDRTKRDFTKTEPPKQRFRLRDRSEQEDEPKDREES